MVVNLVTCDFSIASCNELSRETTAAKFEIELNCRTISENTTTAVRQTERTVPAIPQPDSAKVSAPAPVTQMQLAE